jgi:5'-3' exonuclease
VGRFRDDPAVEQIVICSPDKDLAQLVSGAHVVCWDRRREIVYDAAAVVAKYGVPPESIPDYLALVGDTADGYPGIPGWGAKSAATVLARFGRLEAIPIDPAAWGLGNRAVRLSESLRANWDEAMLFRRLSTLRGDVPIRETVQDLEWRGAHERLKDVCAQLGDEKLPGRVKKWAQAATPRQ